MESWAHLRIVERERCDLRGQGGSAQQDLGETHYVDLSIGDQIKDDNGRAEQENQSSKQRRHSSRKGAEERKGNQEGQRNSTVENQGDC